jgi:hypothetical protein
MKVVVGRYSPLHNKVWPLVGPVKKATRYAGIGQTKGKCSMLSLAPDS